MLDERVNWDARGLGEVLEGRHRVDGERQLGLMGEFAVLGRDGHVLHLCAGRCGSVTRLSRKRAWLREGPN